MSNIHHYAATLNGFNSNKHVLSFSGVISTYLGQSMRL